MKKADNFNPAKWLVENKITFQSKLNEMEKFDATAYQEKSNFEPKQYGDKYNVQFEVAYVDGITSGNIMYKTFDVYAESEGEAIKKGEARLKEWSYTAFDGDPEFEMESYEFYGIENESEMDRNSDSLNENEKKIYGIEKKIYGIEKDYSPYDFGPYTYEEAKAKAMEYASEDPRNMYQPRLYNDMRDELPAIERMYTPRMDKDGNLEDVDSTPFNQGDLADY
jgi:hypothetical protein